MTLMPYKSDECAAEKVRAITLETFAKSGDCTQTVAQ